MQACSENGDINLTRWDHKLIIHIITFHNLFDFHMLFKKTQSKETESISNINTR